MNYEEIFIGFMIISISWILIYIWFGKDDKDN